MANNSSRAGGSLIYISSMPPDSSALPLRDLEISASVGRPHGASLIAQSSNVSHCSSVSLMAVILTELYNGVCGLGNLHETGRQLVANLKKTFLRGVVSRSVSRGPGSSALNNETSQ
ncbi:hypothetical protein Q8A67_024107 [Cirrhinus molitorella]|uniref:Uncharacterized protein n=1 Tax=Cirrhinus molitorella TaxID=172907 RepID=A0AA88P1D2_9TELE|nr:hypothetical protein Q8A67_024107 [Cirrhinus molitorella]